MKTRIYLPLLSLFLLIVSNVQAQTPLLRYHSLFKGKEKYNVNTIYQDTRGMIWFGTDRGLFRSDGVNNDLFTTAEGLSDDNVISLHATKDNVLWIGHKNGNITLFSDNSFTPFKPEEGLGEVPVTDIVSDSTGVIWYSTDGEGIFRYDGLHLSSLDAKDGLSGDEVYDIEIDRNGVLWLATYSGITRYSEGKCEIISMKDGLPDNYVRALKSAADGKLWIGTDEKGVSVYDPEERSFISPGNWDFGSVTGLASGMENEVWVSTEKNCLIQCRIYSNTSSWYRRIKISPADEAIRINTVIRDIEENIWVGGPSFVTQVLTPVFEFLNRTNGTPFDLVSSLLEDSSGNFWVCSEKGLYRGIRETDENFAWVNISEKMGTVSTNFISLCLDHMGKIWAGTYGEGVFRIDPLTLKYTKYTTLDGLSDNNVVSISAMGERIWFSTLGGGISLFSTASQKIKRFNNSELKESYVYATRPDKKGRTWIAGSLRYPAYIFRDSLYLMNNTGQRVPQLYGVTLDSSGNPWFNTRDKGIIFFEGDSIRVAGKSDGISFDKIQSVVFDKFNNLVVISEKGLLFYKPGKGVILEYGENSGLSYQYPVDNAVYTDKQGQIWIGTEKGIIKYNPEYLHIERNIPRVFLSKKDQNYSAVPRGREKFRYKDNNFTFGYTGIWLSNPEGLKYRYMLKGNDPVWNYSNRSQSRTYSKLPAGKYSFIAEASLDEKNWYGSPDSEYSFEVFPPFWRTWWFISGMILLTVFSIYTYIRLRLLKLEKDKKLLEEEVQKRTEEVRKQNKELADQKKEIEVQRDIAEEQRDKIEVQKEEIQASIRYAQRIQSAALPPKKQLDNILGEYFILNKPCDIVSGDFYWVARIGTNIFFAAGDCTGHGVPGAFMSMLGLSALNDIVKSLKTCRASTVLDLLRERIQESLHQGGDREMVSHDGMDISLCILDTESRRLQFSAARNPLYVIRNGEIMVFAADKIDIGNFSIEKLEFTNNEFQCEKGDILYLFTDGYADQFGGPKRKKYKYQQFKDYLVSIHKNPMEIQKQLLDEEIERWKGQHRQIDDILVMGIRI